MIPGTAETTITFNATPQTIWNLSIVLTTDIFPYPNLLSEAQRSKIVASISTLYEDLRTLLLGVMGTHHKGFLLTGTESWLDAFLTLNTYCKDLRTPCTDFEFN